MGDGDRLLGEHLGNVRQVHFERVLVRVLLLAHRGEQSGLLQIARGLAVDLDVVQRRFVLRVIGQRTRVQTVVMRWAEKKDAIDVRRIDVIVGEGGSRTAVAEAGVWSDDRSRLQPLVGLARGVGEPRA